MELIIARHGETEYNVRGLVNSNPIVPCALTEKGRLQAIELGHSLRSEEHNFDAIFTSRLPRTIETLRHAYPFAEFTVSRFLDEIHMGLYESQPYAAYKSVVREPDIKAPGGESFVDVCIRFDHFLERVSNEYRKILIIGHADTVRAAHVSMAGMDLKHAKTEFHPNNCEIFKLNT